MKNKNVFLNERGSALTYVMGLIVVMSIAGVTLNKNSILLGEQGQREIFKTNRDHLSRDLNTFFSSRQNCEKYFNTATYSGGVVNYSVSSLASSLQTDEKLIYPKVELEVKELKSVSGLSSSPTENITRTMTSLEYKVNGRSNSEVAGLSTPDDIPLAVPIVFEFARNSAGQMRFYSCYSKDTTAYTSQVACEAMGGIYNSLGDCRLERKTYNASTNTVDITSNHNLQDVLCEIERNVDKQKQVNNGFLNNNNMGVSSKFCPSPVWNGCRIGQPPNETWTAATIKLKPNKIEDYVTKELAAGNAARFSRAIQVMDVTANALPAAAAGGSISVSGQSSMPILPGPPGATNLLAASAGATAGYAAASYTTAMTLGPLISSAAIPTVTGSITVAGHMGSVMVQAAPLGPYAPLIAVGVAIVFSTILKCDDRRKLTPKYSCVNGVRELEEIRMEKKKFRCKSFSCGCKWRHEETFTATSIEEIAKNISDGVLTANIALAQPVYTDDGAEAAAEIQQILDSIDQRLDGNTVTVQVEIPEDESNPHHNGTTDPMTQPITYGGVQNLTDFYALHADIFDSANNQFGFEEFYQMDLNGDPSTETTVEADINNEILALKSKVNNKEVSIWDDLISDINALVISSTKTSSLDNYCQEYVDNKGNVHYSGANNKPSAVKSRINAKSLYTTLINQKQALITSLQAQISAATNPITITNLTNQKTAAESAKSDLETEKLNSPCAAIAGISY